MKFLSVCSGIEAASVAWEPLGWKAVAFSEIEPFPCSLLAHRFPNTPNLGDMNNFKNWKLNESIDVLVGGTPCQSFSVAGLRGGLDDPRGGLMLTFLKIAQKFQPRWIVWENVPGVLSSNGGRDFGSLLGGLAELGYGWAYRVLDAQHFGVAQRRRRVFVVGCLGGLPPRFGEIFFESEGVRRDSAPSRGAREEAAAVARRGAQSLDVDSDGLQTTVGTLCADTHPGAYSGQDAYTGRLVPHFFDAYQHHGWRESDTAGTLTANLSRGVCGDSPLAVSVTGSIDHTLGRNHGQENAIAYGIPGNWIGRAPENGGNAVEPMLNVAPCQTRTDRHGVAHGLVVRRLTPVECERLQGFPDGWTDVPHKGKPASDTARYKAIGNSMAVPVMRWIGERIQLAEK